MTQKSKFKEYECLAFDLGHIYIENMKGEVYCAMCGKLRSEEDKIDAST